MADFFNNVLYGVEKGIRGYLESLSLQDKRQINEIRLRKNGAVALTVGDKTKYLTQRGTLCDYVNQLCVLVSPSALEESFNLLCGGSVFAHENQLKKGYISLKNGCRCGVGGVFSSGGVSEVTSLNIRIARQVRGAANKIALEYNGRGLLIAGPPASGKTTILRDLVRQISEGHIVQSKRVTVIDSRGELYSGGLDLGPNTDVINIGNKAKGTQMAVRTLFPQVIAFDEIGTEEELKELEACFFAGVEIITTAHIGSEKELFKRGVTKKLIESGVIEQVAVLPHCLGEKIKLFSVKEIWSFA